MNSRQIGTFYIDSNMVDKYPEEVGELLALLNFVPVRCEYLYALNQFQYVGISNRFKELPFGTYVPEYIVNVTRSKGGNIELVEVVMKNIG